MAAIAYITDSKLIELHRLNMHQTINFWRLSQNVNFSDFKKGDLVFFLSKDKIHKKNKEKGVVGFGRLVTTHLKSVNYMWNKYKTLNGYNSLKEFKEALTKVNKEHKLPEKISSLLLEDVLFFQEPIYLSECGMQISNSVESYIYLKPESVALKLLELSRNNIDIWSSGENGQERVDYNQLLYALNTTHNLIKDVSSTVDLLAKRTLKSFIKEHHEYQFVQDSKNELFMIKENKIELIFFRHKNIDIRLLLGQAYLYKKYLEEYYPYNLELIIKTIDHEKKIKRLEL